MSTRQRPTIARPDHDGQGRAAVEALVAELQTGWDRSDAEIVDRRFGADIAMYVLVRHDYDRWLAAGQNTRMRPGGAA
jgi:hypothetical protein